MTDCWIEKDNRLSENIHTEKGPLSLHRTNILFVLTRETERCTELDTSDADLKQTMKQYVIQYTTVHVFIIIK